MSSIMTRPPYAANDGSSRAAVEILLNRPQCLRWKTQIVINPLTNSAMWDGSGIDFTLTDQASP